MEADHLVRNLPRERVALPVPLEPLPVHVPVLRRFFDIHPAAIGRHEQCAQLSHRQIRDLPVVAGLRRYG